MNHMSTKHTPEPWSIQACNSSGTLVYHRIHAGEQRIAGVYDANEANAKLIAASPKLAAALVGMLRAYGNCGSPLQQAAADAADEALRDAGVPPDLTAWPTRSRLHALSSLWS